MTYVGNKIILKDTPQLDAFGRLRVSSAVTLFDAQQEYGLDTLTTWDATANGTLSIATPSSNGSVSDGSGNAVGPRDANTRMTPITVGTTSGHYAVLQSRQYIRYIPGKSQLILITGVFSPGAVANTDARVGYFDAFNGVFLKVTNGNASVVRRTSTSGSVVDNDVPQASWNVDVMDGTGPSGITLDLTKTQILFIQAQWLGVGRVTIGFDINGVFYPVHEFLNANVLTVPYTQTFNLPVRLELRNSGTSAGATINFVCCSVASESGNEARGFPRSASNGITTIGVTTRRPVLSIRPKATYNSVTNRGHIEQDEFLLSATTNSAFYEVVIGGTLTGASFASVGANSIAEFDVAATAITGGTVVKTGIATTSGAGATASGRDSGEVDIRSPLVLSQIDSLAATQVPLTIVVTSFSGTSNVSAVMNWHEQVI